MRLESLAHRVSDHGPRSVLRALRFLAVLATGALLTATGRAEEPLRVCATTPDLGSIVESIGGPEVEVTVFTKGPQDPHNVAARPSFIRAVHDADLFVQVGLELEIGWAPALLRAARNPRVTPGSSGHLDASSVIRPLRVPPASVDRSAGDVHTLGNPHYLLDPLNGLLVAGLVRERLTKLRPESREGFAQRLDEFRSRLVVGLLGEELAARYRGETGEKLLELLRRGRLSRFLSYLESRGERALLGGWLGRLAERRGSKVIGDHDSWPYIAELFELQVVGFLEPKPGISPTTRHLADLIAKVRSEKVRAVLSSVYFDPRHARFVAQHTGIRVVTLAHQTGATKEATDYLATVASNVERLVEGLSAGDAGS